MTNINSKSVSLTIVKLTLASEIASIEVFTHPKYKDIIKLITQLLALIYMILCILLKNL